MLTKEERAEINRSKAKKSTGPRSEEGKKRASLNATRHGLTGQVVVLPTEDMDAYFHFEAEFVDTFNPQGPIEKQLVQVIVDCSWKMNRSRAYQDQILSQKAFHRFDNYSEENNHQLTAALAVASVVEQHTKELSNLSSYEQRYYRMFERAHDRLKALQAEREEKERMALIDAEGMLALHEAEELEKQEAREIEAGKCAELGLPTPAPYIPSPYDPAADGFVFKIVDIQAHTRRRQRLNKGLGLRRSASAAA